MPSFGERLKKLREEKELSQEELGKRFNLSQSTIAYYEVNKKQPSQNTLNKMADFFNVSIDYLLGRTDDPNPPEKKEPSVAYTATLTDKDERDIAKRLEEIKKDLEHAEGLSFYGEPLSEEAKESFLEAMEYIVRTTKKINKKYTPKKYRKEDPND